MRIFHKTGSLITEFTEDVKKYSTGSKAITYNSGDYFYIASDFPFNHLYFKLGTSVNAQPVTMNIEYWSDNDWQSVVNKNDYTEAFSKSGFIEFTPDRDAEWTYESTNYGGNLIPDLSTITVYDMYWTRISLSGTADEVDFDWIGHLFSNDNDLYAEYPIFNDTNFLNCFGSGKTDWQEQHSRAADLIVKDLKSKNIVFGGEQILNRDVFIHASIYKVAEIIYNAFGRDYQDSRAEAISLYKSSMDLSQFAVDKNNNGALDKVEVSYREGWLSR